MSYRIEVAPEFARRLKKLSKRYKSIKQDYEDFLHSLQSNPLQGVDLGKGLRKIRMSIASKGKGKSGGARVISFVAIMNEEDGFIELLTIYDKSTTEFTSRFISTICVSNGRKVTRKYIRIAEKIKI